MAITSVSKTFFFCAGHQLPGHPGKCKNLHGHNYKLVVSLTGPIINDMVVDYSDLKSFVKTTVDALDHSFILTDGSPEWIKEGVTSSRMKVFKMKKRATTENILEVIYEILKRKLDNLGFNEHSLYLTLWESESSYSERV